jgi:2-methylaconitate isomerase
LKFDWQKGELMMIDRGHQWGIPAVFMRGGTSKAIIFKRSDLPEDDEQLRRFFLGAMGSPDINGRQLDGMGGGLSSLSKICIVGPSSRDDADVDYTFVQIGVKDDAVDYDSACGNMTSAIGPFAVDEGLVDRPQDGNVTVRIHATNMGKIIRARFKVSDGLAAVSGECETVGVSGRGAGIRLDFMDPGNSRGFGLLPEGNGISTLALPNGMSINATLVDSANPCVFVRAQDFGLSGLDAPDVIGANFTVMQNLEEVRRAASVKMGMAPDIEQAAKIQSVPKIAMIAGPGDYQTLAGETICGSSYDISARMISMGQAHKAMPVTGALCVATAARLANTLVSHIISAPDQEQIRIGTPSGVLEVEAVVDITQPDDPRAKQASIWRTTRRLMEGMVLVPKENRKEKNE